MRTDREIIRLGEKILEQIQLNDEILKLTDEIRDIKKRMGKTPFYRIIERYKLYKEWKNVDNRSKEIGKIIKKMERNPIQIVAKE